MKAYKRQCYRSIIQYTAFCMYESDYTNRTELNYDTSTREISTLYDQTTSGDHASQTTSSNHPTLCIRNERLNGRYF